MERNMDYTLLYRVAKSYFMDKKTQQEIADVENFSRSQISRLLKKALEEELVTYALNFPTAVDEKALAEELRQTLGLEKVVLIPSFYQDYQRANSDDICKNLALGASDKLGDLLGDAKNIGLGWGRTMYNTSLYVRPQRIVKGRTFLPLIGLSGDNTPALQINAIVDRFGERFHAERKYVNLQSLQTRTPLNPRDEASVKSLLARWKELDAVIVGIGGSPSDTKNLISEYPPHYKKQLRASGTVGDILSQFFYEDGRIFDMDIQFRLLALNIDQLHSIKNVIAMACGREKCRSICAASDLGYIKTLVTDYDTAHYILSYKKGETET